MKVIYYICGEEAKITFIAENVVEVRLIELAALGYERGGTP